MVSVANDADLLSHLREATSARSTSQFPDSELRQEAEDAKVRINREVAGVAGRNQFDLYGGTEAATNALVAYMELRVEELVRQRTPEKARSDEVIPKAIGKLRRTEFTDATLRHRRNRLIKHLNDLSD